MSLLNKVPKELIIEIIKKAKKKYYKLTYGIMTRYVCGNVGMMYEIIRKSIEIQKEIIGFWLYNFEKYFSYKLTKDASKLRKKLFESRQKEGTEWMYNYVLEILKKYPVPDAKIEQVFFYGDRNTNLYKMSKNKLIKYLYRIPSMKCYWFYFAIHNEEYYFYLENKMDIVQKIDKTIIDNLIKEVKQLYQNGHLYIFDDFSKKVRMAQQKNLKLVRGEKIIQLNHLSKFVNSKLTQIIRYHLGPTSNHVFGLLDITE